MVSLVKVLFVSNASDSFRSDICFLVKRQLEKVSPNSECKILEPREVPLSFFDCIFDKKTNSAAEAAIKAFKPDVIVLTGDTSIAATFIKLGRMMKIPTLAIQSVLVIESPYLGENVKKAIFNVLGWKTFRLWRLLSLFSRNSLMSKITFFVGWRTRAIEWGLGGADLYAVMGDYTRRLIVSRGVSPQNVRVTGNPLFDVAPPKSDVRKEELRRLLKLGNESIVLLTTQPVVEDKMCPMVAHESFVKSVISAAKQLKLQLIIKSHPREDFNKYDSIIHEVGYEKVVFVENCNLHELIDLSDVVITATSTSGFWAIAHGKPLISISYFQMPYVNPYTEIATHLENLAILPDVLKEVLNNREKGQLARQIWDEKVQHYIYKVDGMASARIAQLILALYKRSGR